MARHSGQISEVQTKDRQNGLKILIAIFILLALSTDFIYGIWLERSAAGRKRWATLLL